MAPPLPPRNARRSVFPWWTTVVALGLVLWMRGADTGSLVEGPESTQLSWPKGTAPVERVNAKASSSTPSSTSQDPAVDPNPSGPGSASGSSLGVPPPR